MRRLVRTSSYAVIVMLKSIRVPFFLVVCAGLVVGLAPSSCPQALPPNSVASHVNAATASNASIQEDAKSLFGQLPLRFERNEGQSGEQVKFLTQNGAYALFLTSREAVLTLSRRNHRPRDGKPVQSPAVVRLRLVGANANPRVVGVDELPGRTNHFVGNNPKKWHTNVTNYEVGTEGSPTTSNLTPRGSAYGASTKSYSRPPCLP